jgi:ADP-heptose:LPS heptosyltransferase
MSFSLKRIFRTSYAIRSVYWLVVLNWFDLAIKLLPRPTRRSGKKRVLFVKMDGIGDYVIWSAVFRSLRKLYPSDQFERILVGNDRFQELAESESTFDDKFFVNLDRFAVSPVYRFRKMKQMRDVGADIVLNARTSRDLLWGDSMVRCSGADEKIGSVGAGNLMGPRQAAMTRRWYTSLRSAPVEGEHELITNLKFLGVDDKILSVGDWLSSTSVAREIPDLYAVYFLGSQITEKCWPAENFAKAAEIISRQHDLKTVICGGPADAHRAAAFRNSTGLEHVDLTGNSLTELSSLLGAARLVVSNDTGAAHFSVMSGTPTIVIASGNQVGRYFPYPESIGSTVKVIQYPEFCKGCREWCIHSQWSETVTRPCIGNVSVSDVCDAASEVLDPAVRDS